MAKEQFIEQARQLLKSCGWTDMWQQYRPDPGQHPNAQATLLYAIAKLTEEYYVNDNADCKNHSDGFELQETFVDHLGVQIVQKDYMRLQNGEHATFTQNVLSQLDSDLTAITRLGYLAKVSHTLNTEDQTRLFLEVWPESDTQGPFYRVASRLVEWCRKNPELLELHWSETPPSMKWFFELSK